MADFVYIYKFQVVQDQLNLITSYNASGAFTFYARLDHTSTIRPTVTHLADGIDVYFRFYDESLANELEINAGGVTSSLFNFDNPYAKACSYMEVSQDFDFQEHIAKEAYGEDIQNWISGLSPYDKSGTKFVNIVLSGTLFDDESEMWETDDSYASFSVYEDIDAKETGGFLVVYSGVVQE